MSKIFRWTKWAHSFIALVGSKFGTVKFGTFKFGE